MSESLKISAVLWSIGPLVGVVAGLVALLRPTLVYGTAGLAIAIFGAPAVATWVSYTLVGDYGGQGAWNLMALIFAPISSGLAFFTCGVVATVGRYLRGA